MVFIQEQEQLLIVVVNTGQVHTDGAQELFERSFYYLMMKLQIQELRVYLIDNLKIKMKLSTKRKSFVRQL